MKSEELIKNILKIKGAKKFKASLKFLIDPAEFVAAAIETESVLNN